MLSKRINLCEILFTILIGRDMLFIMCIVIRVNSYSVEQWLWTASYICIRHRWVIAINIDIFHKIYVVKPYMWWYTSLPLWGRAPQIKLWSIMFNGNTNDQPLPQHLVLADRFSYCTVVFKATISCDDQLYLLSSFINVL